MDAKEREHAHIVTKISMLKSLSEFLINYYTNIDGIVNAKGCSETEAKEIVDEAIAEARIEWEDMHLAEVREMYARKAKEFKEDPGKMIVEILKDVLGPMLRPEGTE